MLGRGAGQFVPMGQPNEDELTYTESGYMQDGSTGPEGTSFAAFGRGDQIGCQLGGSQSSS